MVKQINVQARVVLYSSPYCGYCVMAARLLRKKGVVFEELDVADDPEKRAWLYTVTSRRTLPQIFIDNQPVGGFDSIAALDRAGKLDPLLFPEDTSGKPAIAS